MRRQISFTNEIKPEWMDYTASLYLKGKNEVEARSDLKKYLSSYIQSKQNIGRIAGSLIKMWYKSNNHDELEYLKKNLKRIDTIEAYKAYLELIRKTYDFFNDVYLTIKRIEKLNGNFENKEVIKRIAERWGDYPRVKICTERAIRTYRSFKLVIEK